MSFLEFFKPGKEPERGAAESAGEPLPAAIPREFSSRSQRSLVEQMNFQDALERYEAFIKINSERVRELNGIKAYQIEVVASGGDLADYNLSSLVEQTAMLERQLEGYVDHAETLRQKIKFLSQPT